MNYFLEILATEIQKYAVKIQSENDVICAILDELKYLIQKN